MVFIAFWSAALALGLSLPSAQNAFKFLAAQASAQRQANIRNEIPSVVLMLSLYFTIGSWILIYARMGVNFFRRGLSRGLHSLTWGTAVYCSILYGVLTISVGARPILLSIGVAAPLLAGCVTSGIIWSTKTLWVK
jgi:hypothetical protein